MVHKGFSADINQIDPSGMDPDDADVLQVFQEVVDKAIEKIDSDDIVINLDDVPSFKRAPLPSINTYSLLNDKVTNKLPITSPISEELDGQLFFSWNINGAPQNAPAVATFVTLSNSANELNINRPKMHLIWRYIMQFPPDFFIGIKATQESPL